MCCRTLPVLRRCRRRPRVPQAARIYVWLSLRSGKGGNTKIGVHFVNFDVPGGVEALPTTLASAARAAEQAGAAWFTMADHFFQMENLWPAESPML